MASNSCRCDLIALRVVPLSANEVQLSQHDDDQGGAEGEVEGVELDWNGHSCLIGLVMIQSRDKACSRWYQASCS